MSPLFQPPAADLVPPILPETKGLQRRLFRHFKARARGQSVLRIGGVYRTVVTPDQILLDTATEVYLGGHVYEVSTAVSDALIAAGYTTSPSPAPDETTWGEVRGSHWSDVITSSWGNV